MPFAIRRFHYSTIGQYKSVWKNLAPLEEHVICQCKRSLSKDARHHRGDPGPVHFILEYNEGFPTEPS